MDYPGAIRIPGDRYPPPAPHNQTPPMDPPPLPPRPFPEQNNTTGIQRNSPYQMEVFQDVPGMSHSLCICCRR